MKSVFKNKKALRSSGKIEIIYRKKKVSPPYNALHLQVLLKERARKAFKPKVYKGIYWNGVINKCAAYTMRNFKGNPKIALSLLRDAGEVADMNGKTTIPISSLDQIVKGEIIKAKFNSNKKQFLKDVKILLKTIKRLSKKQKRSKKKLWTGDIIHYTVPTSDIQLELKGKLHNEFFDVVEIFLRQGDGYAHRNYEYLTYMEGQFKKHEKN